jgi:uncharacterized membrane protein YbaN (DUF454 family)
LISAFRLLWLLGGIVFVAVGAIGVVLPLLPTTPFLLLAAYCFARSSTKLHDWLLNHRSFGPLINNWDQHGSIDRRSKRIAIVVIVLTAVISILIGVPWWALASQIVVLAVAATFILTRPDPPPSS